MNVCGIDVSTYNLDFVWIDDEGPSQWCRITLEGADAWERCRTVHVPSEWFEDTEAVGMEVAHGPSSGAINRVVGAVLSRLPRGLLVEQWTATQWKKAVGLSGNASKTDVEKWAVRLRLDDVAAPAPGETITFPLWPQDACDAFCIALATQKALEREAA